MNIKAFKGAKGRGVIRSGHIEVLKLPRLPQKGLSYWLNSANGRCAYTHQLFRFPAKFHPPVVQWALGTFGRRGSSVLDPFTGSGTVQVEALVRGIHSLGIDVDPLACLIAQSKITPIDPGILQINLHWIGELLEPFFHSHTNQENEPEADISVELFEKESVGLNIPALPNIFHWFRKYIIVDLARIQWAIEQACTDQTVRLYFLACFAAIIRRVSNADPDPVSGLEVTKIQRERNKKRAIKVYDIFFRKVKREIVQMERLRSVLNYNRNISAVQAHVVNGDILKLEPSIDFSTPGEGFPLIITSPPYCRSVLYSHRHKLELFWLKLIHNPDEHIQLTHSYIGRGYVRVNDWNATNAFGIQNLDSTLRRIYEIDPHKARTIHHYFSSMIKTFNSLRNIISKRGTFVCVIGDSVCCGIRIATSDFLVEIASDYFELKNRFSYAIQNHHMQYGLWNGDGIKEEHVLVLKPRR